MVHFGLFFGFERIFVDFLLRIRVDDFFSSMNGVYNEENGLDHEKNQEKSWVFCINCIKLLVFSWKKREKLKIFQTMQKNIAFLDEDFSEISYTTLVKPEQKQPLFLCSCCGNLLAYKGLFSHIFPYFPIFSHIFPIISMETRDFLGYLTKSQESFSMFKAMY